jgi:hypothetical protein
MFQWVKSRADAFLPAAALLIAGISLWLYSMGKYPEWYLTAGSDGPYFPLQVRQIMESGRLAFPDMPLLFWLTASLASLLKLLGVSEPVLKAVMAFDLLWLVLLSLVVFQVFKHLLRPLSAAGLLFLVAFSVLNNSSLLVFSFQLQKNAFALPMIFAFLAFWYRYRVLAGGRPALIAAIFCMFLICLTHFGSFCVIVFFLLIDGIPSLWNRKRTFLSHPAFLWFFILLRSGLAIIWFADPQRFTRLLQFPLRAFSNPVFFLGLKGLGNSGLWLLHAVFFVAGGYYLFKYGREEGIRSHRFFLSIWLFGLLLLLPVWGQEWFRRFNHLVFIPETWLLGFILSGKRKIWLLLLFLPAVEIAGSLANRFQSPLIQAISKESLEDFRHLHLKTGEAACSLVTGRQDLRLLAAWYFRIKSSADYLISREDVLENKGIYFIIQKEGLLLPKARFREVSVPVSAQLREESKYFRLYLLQEPFTWKSMPGKPPLAAGKVQEVKGSKLLIRTGDGSIRQINLNRLDEIPVLLPGQDIIIWGRILPFSRVVEAEEIRFAAYL